MAAQLKAYFDSLPSSESLSEEAQVEAGSSVLRCEHHLKGQIKELKLHLGPPTALETLIQALRRKLNFDLEEQIKLERLKEAVRMEGNLKDKLESVQEQIQALGPVVEPQKPAKLRTYTKETRERVRGTEEDKAKEAKQLAERLAEEQKVRELKWRKEWEKMEFEEKKEKDEKARLAIELAEARERKKQERVGQLQALTNRRKEQMAEIKELLKHSKVPRLNLSATPLVQHKHSGEKISIKELVQEHSAKYSEAKKTYEAKRFQSLITQKLTSDSHSPSFHYYYDVQSERKARLKSQHEESVLRDELNTKRKRYASLVKEMYAPVIDAKKQQEIERLKEKIHTVPRASRPIDRSARPHSLSHTDSLDSNSRKEKHAKSVHLEPAKPTTRPTNYLLDLRQKRLSAESAFSTGLVPLDPEPGDSPDGLLAKANRLEQRALKQAKLLRHSDPLSLEVLEKAEGVDKALLSSVRAKLSLLPL